MHTLPCGAAIALFLPPHGAAIVLRTLPCGAAIALFLPPHGAAIVLRTLPCGAAIALFLPPHSAAIVLRTLPSSAAIALFLPLREPEGCEAPLGFLICEPRDAVARRAKSAGIKKTPSP